MSVGVCGKGDVQVVLHVQPTARDELLRLTLKSNSEVDQTAGGLVMRLYVDRWEWLVPLVTSYGADVRVEEPVELRRAVVAHLRGALDIYRRSDTINLDAVADRYRNDDSRLRSTRGRTLTE